MNAANISPQLQQVLNAFQATPGLAPVQYQNLLAAITETPELLQTMNLAAAQDRLRHIAFLSPRQSGSAAYSSNEKTVYLGDSHLHFLGRETRKVEMIGTLGHEIQHAFFRETAETAQVTLHNEVRALSTSGQPAIDYTAAALKYQQVGRMDESQAAMTGWNMAVSYLQAKDPNSPVTLEKIYTNYERSAGYIERTQVNGAFQYAMKPGYVLNPDMRMDIHNPQNIEAMGRDFYDRSRTLGHYGNSDYTNQYATYTAAVIADAHARRAPHAELRLDMPRLGWSEKLLEQNGLQITAPGGQQPYRDVHTPAVQRFFDHTAPADPTADPPASPNPHAHQYRNNGNADPYTPPFARPASGPHAPTAPTRGSSTMPSAASTTGRLQQEASPWQDLAVQTRCSSEHLQTLHDKIGQAVAPHRSLSPQQHEQLTAYTALQAVKHRFDLQNIGDVVFNHTADRHPLVMVVDAQKESFVAARVDMGAAQSCEQTAQQIEQVQQQQAAAMQPAQQQQHAAPRMRM